jgi:hypothetical protein
MDGGSIKRIVQATELELKGNPAQLRHELEAADIEFSVRQAWEKEGKKRLPLSPADWLMGKRLPEIYSLFFGVEAGRSRDKKNGAPSGPCVRFIQACLREMEIGKRDQANEPKRKKLISRLETLRNALKSVEAQLAAFDKETAKRPELYVPETIARAIGESRKPRAKRRGATRQK